VKLLSMDMSPWSAFWLRAAVLLGGAVVLCSGIVLASVLAILAALLMLPAWIRGLWTRRSAPRAAVVIEGRCTRETP
jgi:hypothetical protein